MKKINTINIPDEFLTDIEKAISILKKIGFKELYLFGSLAKNKTNKDSDIDLAVKGIPDNKFFYAIGKLEMELDHRIDLINLDRKTDFNELILNKMELIKIA